MAMEVKGCPWCGSQPKVYRTRKSLVPGADLKGWWVECNGGDCPCVCACVGPYPTMKEAVEAWNLRKYRDE